MPKDIEQFLKDERNSSDFISPALSHDPNFIPNQAQTDEISKHNREHFVSNSIGTIALNFLVAPLTTIYTSLQLSVLPHKNKYGDVPQEEQLKALVKTSTEITPQERRKYELMIRSGVTGNNRPFRAPVYAGYGEVVRALANQGFLGFFKGYMIGCQHALLNSYLRFTALSRLDYEWNQFWHKGNALMRSVLLFGTTTSFDIILNPIMMCQSRFILQNRLPNFYLYKSQMNFYQKHYMMSPKEFFKGASGHIYKNLFVLAATLTTLPMKREEIRIVSNVFLGMIISYPWITAIRRLHCQSKLPGMIPLRYRGPLHCINLMFQEEGIKGLYRGFMAYFIANSFINYLMLFNLIHGQEEVNFN